MKCWILQLHLSEGRNINRDEQYHLFSFRAGKGHTHRVNGFGLEYVYGIN